MNLIEWWWGSWRWQLRRRPIHNSHLCSFVLTQFCLTHPLAQHIWNSPRGDIFRNCWRFGGWKAPHHPFHAADTPSPFFVLLCQIKIDFEQSLEILSCRILLKSRPLLFSPLHFQLVSREGWLEEFPRIASGGGNGEDQVGEMVSSTGYLPSTYYIHTATTSSMVLMKTV